MDLKDAIRSPRLEAPHIRGIRSHRSKTQMEGWKDEDTHKKGKMA